MCWQIMYSWVLELHCVFVCRIMEFIHTGVYSANTQQEWECVCLWLSVPSPTTRWLTGVWFQGVFAAAAAAAGSRISTVFLVPVSPKHWSAAVTRSGLPRQHEPVYAGATFYISILKLLQIESVMDVIIVWPICACKSKHGMLSFVWFPQKCKQ